MLATVRRAPGSGCAELVAPAALRLRSAGRCALECAHALRVVKRSAPRQRIDLGSAVHRRRIGTASKSVLVIDVIAPNQTSEAWDE